MERKWLFKTILVLFYFNLFSVVGVVNSFSQDFGKLWVVGNNIQIIYSTLDQYESGITLSGWTRVKVTIKCVSCLPTDTWEIRLFARSDAINYSGSEVDVDDIEFSDFPIVVNILGTVPGVTVNTPFILQEATPATSDGLILISGSNGMGLNPGDPPFEFEFTLSYSLPGMQNRAKENAMFFTVVDMLLISD